MNRLDPTFRGGRTALTLLSVIALVAAACETTAPKPSATATAVAQATPAPTSPATTPAATTPSVTAGPPARIPQPDPPAGLTVAPESARVDLAMPVFSNPTQVTNPLFPVSQQASVLLLGHVDGKAFRTEVTLLPETRVVDWDGVLVETLVSQYTAFLDGRIQEVAYDLYAQADDGAVWYFGEDVFDFADGAIISTEGTWLAGRDAPAAMIMPGQPKVGDVYRPENAPDFVFEEVTVQEIGVTLDGPLGPIPGGLRILELHSDGSTEDKLFAPGYGEFLTGGGGDLEALALGVPTDALAESVPADLRTLSDGALRAFDAAGAGRWTAAATEVAALQAARAALGAGIVPSLIAPLLDAALQELAGAVQARKAARARNASIEVARLAFDVQLRYRPVIEVDLARADLWAAQILVDAAAGDAAGVSADVFALDYIRDRLGTALGAAVTTSLNVPLGELQSAILDGDMDAAVQAATALRAVLAGLPAS